MELQNDVISKKIVKDLQEFFNDNYIDVLKIIPHGYGGTLKFYEIHFDNKSIVDLETLTSLDKFGYTPKSLRGSLPDSFFLLVLLRKKI